jgi:hypothetical protein
MIFDRVNIWRSCGVVDLLDSTKEKLDVRQTPDGNVVPGLSEVVVQHKPLILLLLFILRSPGNILIIIFIQVTSVEQVMSLMNQGQANRAVGSHDMNEHSSRSHSILTLICRGQNNIDKTTTFGELDVLSRKLFNCTNVMIARVFTWLCVFLCLSALLANCDRKIASHRFGRIGTIE